MYLSFPRLSSMDISLCARTCEVEPTEHHVCAVLNHRRLFEVHIQQDLVLTGVGTSTQREHSDASRNSVKPSNQPFICVISLLKDPITLKFSSKKLNYNHEENKSRLNPKNACHRSVKNHVFSVSHLKHNKISFYLLFCMSVKLCL
jgi:hypothetical protein